MSAITLRSYAGTPHDVRMRRFFMAMLAYAACMPLLGLAYLLGLMSAFGAVTTALASIAVNLGLWFVFDTRLNERFADPSLTWAQVVIATTLIMWAVYHADHNRGLILMMSLVVLAYGTNESGDDQPIDDWDALRAAVRAAEGTIAAGSGDHDDARRAFEDALDLLAISDARFDAARLRLDLADSLLALGRQGAARRELDAAHRAFTHLGATHLADQAATRLPHTAAAVDNGEDSPLGALTPREREVLALIVEGRTNPEIAKLLVLSEHTVHRHVTNMLRKLNLPSRAAAAALASRHGLT